MGGRKARDISICCKNCSQGRYSYFTFPLGSKGDVSVGKWCEIKHMGFEKGDFCNFVYGYDGKDQEILAYSAIDQLKSKGIEIFIH